MSALDLTAAAVELVERTRAEQGLPPHVEDPAALRQVARILSSREATPVVTRGRSSSSRPSSSTDTERGPDV